MSPEKPDNTRQKVTAGLMALVVIALLAGGAVVYGNKSSTSSLTPIPAASSPTTNASTSATTPAASSSSNTSSNSGYKDGTYSASSTYYVPHGSESIKVTLTVTGGTVTDSSIENSEYSRESALFQEDFASEYKSSVVGKPISSLELNYVAGASDTTQGFNDALQQIKNQAQA